MNDRIDPLTETEATQTLALLNGQADDLRADLVRLRQELAAVQLDVSGNRVAQLQEANQMLVLAALSAEGIAKTAIANLSELTYSSQRDTLTHTANRALMLDRLTVAIASANQHQARLAILFLDLDHFRYINNTLGHAGGDVVLQLVASRLKSVLQDGDTVSRHGGDEFLVLLTHVSDASDAARIAALLLAAVAVPSSIGMVRVQLSASLGIAMYPEDGLDMATLIDRADLAMYRSKGLGPGGFQFHGEAPLGESGQRSAAIHLLPLVRHESLPVAEDVRLADLRDANEQLVMAALTAQELEAHAREAHRQQIKFMAMVAHELRNPLTPIRVAASLMIDRDTNDELSLARLQVIIDGQVTHMSRLIGDLLEGSRISTGKLRLERGSVEMIGVLRMAIEACRPAMEAREQHMTIELPPAPIGFHGDPVRLAQIFTNLLDNASKYTPQGGKISLALMLRGQSMEIIVSDNGIGISAEALPHIFDLFVQDARALDHSSGGLGIGLAVVRELVEAHQGSVTGHSAGRNLGSEFIVTLPMDCRLQIESNLLA
ncbi:diguanylate cyclase [Rhodanobacter sp. A1T4]|uniref:diguanylate cyclase domain-containing protein n=1 Tax=Rhodanobacter sp. A1T4 TaxID=2723087 RepID=UPI001608F3B9|nr:diguanylate cyclase (GGDEF)-like protein [Rhodanobacter sp. A1T4]